MNALVLLLLAMTIAPTTLPIGVSRQFEPRTTAQHRILFSRAPEIAVSGGWGTGKTHPLGHLAFWMACEYPGIELGVCMEEAASIKGAIARTLREKVIPPALNYWRMSRSGRGWGWKEEGAGVLYLPPRDGRQSVIWMIGLDKPERLYSRNLHSLLIDQGEQLTFDQWTKARSRAYRQPEFPFPRVVTLFNPDRRRHWANERYQFNVGSRRMEIGDGDASTMAEVVVCKPEDALLFATPEGRAFLLGLQGTWRDRYYLGLWCDAEGAAFPMWRPDEVVIDPPECAQRWGGFPPPDWSRYRGIDFGYRNPFACLTWARDSEGVYHCYRQRMMSERTIDVHRADIIGDERRELETLRASCTPEEAQAYRPYLTGLNIVDSFHDPADPGDAMMLAKSGDDGSPGVWCRPGKNDIAAGVKLVMSMLAQGRIKIWRNSLVEADPGLLERHQPTCLQEEIPAQRHPRIPDSANPVMDKKELLVDEFNHAYKTMHYLFLSLECQTPVGVYA